MPTPNLAQLGLNLFSITLFEKKVMIMGLASNNKLMKMVGRMVGRVVGKEMDGKESELCGLLSYK